MTSHQFSSFLLFCNSLFYKTLSVKWNCILWELLNKVTPYGLYYCLPAIDLVFGLDYWALTFMLTALRACKNWESSKGPHMYSLPSLFTCLEGFLDRRVVLMAIDCYFRSTKYNGVKIEITSILWFWRFLRKNVVRKSSSTGLSQMRRTKMVCESYFDGGGSE